MADARFRDTVATFHEAWLDLGELRGADKDADGLPASGTRRSRPPWPRRPAASSSTCCARATASWRRCCRRSSRFLSGPLYDIYGVAQAGRRGRQRLAAGGPERRPARRAADPARPDGGAGPRGPHLASCAGARWCARRCSVRRCRRRRPGVNDTEGDIPATATAKERAEQHRTAARLRRLPRRCSIRIGFAFETYDAIGRYRTDRGRQAGRVPARADRHHHRRHATPTRSSWRPSWAAPPTCGPAWPGSGCASRSGARTTDDDDASLAAAVEGFQSSGGDLPELLFQRRPVGRLPPPAGAVGDRA